ncbi:hypothetical protein HMPREF1981_00805 [Bacteroides pyogenes F0041]|uniref:Uncharacterized protein n=1 Tax=Bacteroides pyogenes F0041 TaxID=1321819 RepID=U2C847_9BACE|nr:hypothetical protein HMPREF1981_00805 [Bacteroides pyogenes F0041]
MPLQEMTPDRQHGKQHKEKNGERQTRRPVEKPISAKNACYPWDKQTHVRISMQRGNRQHDRFKSVIDT